MPGWRHAHFHRQPTCEPKRHTDLATHLGLRRTAGWRASPSTLTAVSTSLGLQGTYHISDEAALEDRALPTAGEGYVPLDILLVIAF